MTDISSQIETMALALKNTLDDSAVIFETYQKMPPELSPRFEQIANVTYNFAKELLAFNTYVLPSLQNESFQSEKSHLIDSSELVAKLEGDSAAGNA